MAATTTPEAAWPVRELNSKVKGWIERLGQVWVEGQITQYKANPNWKLSYLTLRDPEVEASVQITCPTQLLADVAEGDRVVVLGKPSFYEGRGSFSLCVTEIRQVGLGAMLARIEMLRKQLASEGLFDADRKKPLPFLPNTIGLITGRGSAAERDVLSVAHNRWPDVRFTVINTAVQGARAVPEIVQALQELDADPFVDVIIIARGGGSVEDLLPFSEEALQRAVAAANTPVVSAIGHEPDNPILDNVADLRAATPTDAAKRVVPDVVAERALIVELRARAIQALRGWVSRELDNLTALRSRPVLADPMLPIQVRREEIQRAISSCRREISHRLRAESTQVAALRNQVSALGPSATLARGYAVVQVIPRDGTPPEVVMGIDQSPPGSQLRIRVSDGSITAAAMQTKPAH
ncbi:exodeoxyribonuclease VII large subunit [Corynebacterium felinum]|uniref:Exodeoxyribonuclease 7 large subunit n=1 Tax=Corynebacterium felinum TaxID=131318 RepID=A0ABU2B986_9CORY|nr:exodeoxyribonuclease VII large subunit [Corynebacterium felinum]MDF5822021.1 exodeoxyribonuclease VII large subunit [Corynebacterium felinum]MDR7355192.1 exodeoxyribonuclease VII large subunit [Corynebacterium felinum]WJY94543.1 Exodeoxyribonuclease 7 large subunit [Corynebacterium felinum]